MELEVTQEKLARALSSVSRIATGRVTLPILNNVLIRVRDGKVSLITTNLDMAVVDFLPVSSSTDGVTTVPARLLTEFISNLPKGENVKISAKDDKVTISAGKYTSTINGAPADDFPELPEIDEEKAVVFKIGADEFKGGLTRVLVASSSDFSRPALTGVFFNTNEKSLFAASTDGYRVAEHKLISDVQSEISVIVPSNTLQEVLRALGDDSEEVEISFNDDLVRFRLGEVEIISKLIDAAYPDYRKLIPKEHTIEVELDRGELIRVSKLAALFSRAASGSIICEAAAPDSFSVRSIASELGENTSSVPASVTGEGKASLNSRFFIDALNSFDGETLHISFSGGVTPMLLKNPKNADYVHLVMPLSS